MHVAHYFVVHFGLNRSQNLRQHMILHSDIKSYVCDFCKKAFARKDYLEMHVRTHTGRALFEHLYGH